MSWRWRRLSRDLPRRRLLHAPPSRPCGPFGAFTIVAAHFPEIAVHGRAHVLAQCFSVDRSCRTGDRGLHQRRDAVMTKSAMRRTSPQLHPNIPSGESLPGQPPSGPTPARCRRRRHRRAARAWLAKRRCASTSRRRRRRRARSRGPRAALLRASRNGLRSTENLVDIRSSTAAIRACRLGKYSIERANRHACAFRDPTRRPLAVSDRQQNLNAGVEQREPSLPSGPEPPFSGLDER